MAVNTNTIVSNVYAQNYTPGSKEKTKVARNTETGEVKKEEKVTESKDLGRRLVIQNFRKKRKSIMKN